MPPKRMTANPVAPLRYRPGKPLPSTDHPSSDSDSDSDSDSSPAPKSTAPSRPPPPAAASFPKLNPDLAARDAAAAAARAKRDAAAQEEEGFETASSSSDGPGSDDDAEEEDESDDEEDDYSSDSSAGKPRFVAPTFVARSRRQDAPRRNSHEHDDGAQEREETQRREKADALLAAQLEKQAAERAGAGRDWDDEAGDMADDVDDTDGVDPEAEHAAWRLRELKRVMRERESIAAAEAEREEVERRRNLSAEERKREDEEFIAKQKEEGEGRGKMGVLQKYFHKGAFFQGDDEDEVVAEVKARDVVGRKFQDEVQNRELLPEYMQIRDMTRLGKKGRTRYKDLKSEDTGRFGGDFGGPRGRGEAGARYADDGPTGANGVAVGERRRREGEDAGRDEKRPRY